MDVTAIIAVRNEGAYLANCLRHLQRQDVQFAIIDNQSDDDSAAIYRRREFASHLVAVEQLPFNGEFALKTQLESKMALLASLDTDWAIHLDADEIMHSRHVGETLKEALARIAAQGWNVVNFDEFVFLPIDSDYQPDAVGDQPITSYYFFEPHAPRLMRAWRKASNFSPVEGAGHALCGDDIRLAPENFVLRHYIFRSQAHAYAKYTERKFAAADRQLGWHGNRINQPAAAFAFPPSARLEKLASPASSWDTSAPWLAHYWQH